MDRDNWLEILQVMLRNPVRTLLASVGVAWGIMMLILMVGAGNGLENGVKQEFEGTAANSMFMWTMSTSMPYKGFKQGRWVNLDNGDVEFIRKNVPQVGVVAPRNQLGGWRGANNVIRGTKSGAFNVYGEYPDYIKVEPIQIVEGRYVNIGDLDQHRKVCVIGTKVKEVLFAAEQSPLGEFIEIYGINFQVVGVYKSYKTGEDAEEDQQSIFVPFSTFQRAFNFGDEVGWLSLLSADGYSVSEMQDAVFSALKARKSIHPDDNRAFGSWNLEERMEELNTLFGAFDIVGFFMGFLVLLAGIIGIVNIMLITVKERTKEFGIRRSLGAKPIQIVKQVMQETLFLTSISGLVGMMLGVGILELVNSAMEGSESGSFKNPGVDYELIAYALFTMIICGAVAGLLPALRAIAIKPVDALRAE
jgi:putative ABC transport system permease protein